MCLCVCVYGWFVPIQYKNRDNHTHTHTKRSSLSSSAHFVTVNNLLLLLLLRIDDYDVREMNRVHPFDSIWFDSINHHHHHHHHLFFFSSANQATFQSYSIENFFLINQSINNKQKKTKIFHLSQEKKGIYDKKNFFFIFHW